MKIVGTDANNLPVEVEVDLQEILDRINALRNYPTGYERMAEGEYYFTYDTTTHGTLDINDVGDSEAGTVSMTDYDEGNYYTDEELCENNTRADILMRKLRRFAALEEGITPFVSDAGFIVTFDKKIGALVTNYTDAEDRMPFELRFSSARVANQCIVEFRDELTWFFTEYSPIRNGAEDIDE